MIRKVLEEKIFQVENEMCFDLLALYVFRFQAENNLIYKNYLAHLGVKPENVDSIYQIPFLPIEFFKNHTVTTGIFEPDIIFSSSGTTGLTTSQHHVAKVELYEKSFIEGFEYFYGAITDYTILALLPSYLERNGSSLVYMANKLIQLSENNESGFYLYNHEELIKKIQQTSTKKKFLLGVTFALLDVAEKYKPDLSNCIVMETGGMKGRRKELTRVELHEFLTTRFNVSAIHSEYGMTELLSQGYSKGEGLFFTPPYMKIFIRDTNDPFSYLETGKTGGINVIDLANLYSCSFIETKDLGKRNNDNSFEVLGRFDNSDIRGCNLLVG